MFRHEYLKFGKTSNVLLIGFSAILLFVLSFASVDILRIEKQLYSDKSLLEAITSEFCYTLLLIIPVLTILNMGTEYDNQAMQKTISLGVSRKVYYLCKWIYIIPYLLLAVITFMISVYAITSYQRFEIHENIFLSLLQITLVTLGYFNISFIVINLFKKTKAALLIFYGLVVFEMIATHFLQTYLSIRPNTLLPLSIICSVFLNNNTYTSLNEIPAVQFVFYFLITSVAIYWSWIVVVKRDLPKL